MEVVASQQPSINMIVENDVFRLNGKPDARYGVFAWTQGNHTTSLSSGLIRFNFTLFYIDRLTANQGNQVDVQSAGIDTIDNILRILDEMGISAGDYTFTTFNQRFMDECAGVFANVTFEVPGGSLCKETFADFNDDFNEDFLIY